MLKYTPQEESPAIASVVSLAAYGSVAVGTARLLGAKLWWVFLGLMAARTFFGLVEGIAIYLNWKLFAKPRLVQTFVDILRANGFPMREAVDKDFLDYITRLSQDYEEKPDYERVSRELYTIVSFAERQGILVGMRMHAACDAAFDLYSPKSR